MDRKTEIIKAAERVFLRFGLKKTTLDDIARELDLQKTALYYYFKNKDELMRMMYYNKIETFRNRLNEEVKNTKSTYEKIRKYMEIKKETIEEYRPFIEMIEKEKFSSRVHEILKDSEEKMFDHDFRLLKEIFEEGIKNKEIKVKSVISITMMILGVTYGTLFATIFEGCDWNVKDQFDDSLEIIFKAIKV